MKKHIRKLTVSPKNIYPPHGIPEDESIAKFIWYDKNIKYTGNKEVDCCSYEFILLDKYVIITYADILRLVRSKIKKAPKLKDKIWGM